MRRIRGQDTNPELAVRRIVYRLGFRYRLHVAKLPGKPDLVFSRLRKIIEVRGCFWHCHRGCIDSHIPRSRVEYWLPKLKGNVQRDKKSQKALEREGWRILIVWACETEGGAAGDLAKKLARFLTED